ncbi:MAG: outer membrane protein OmpA-like peptidoglycan-associated protein [Sulfitobacter sp.]|jgi:outer membrane protein OmpA-like peptidoglycan-associated protein
MAAVRTRTTVLLTLAILLIVGFVFGLPLLLKGQIEKELKAVLGLPVAIERLSFNPVVGSARIVGMEIGSHTSLKEFAFDIKVWALLDRHLHIQNLAASEFVLPIKIADTGFTVAGYQLPQNMSSTTDAPTKPLAEPWRVSVDRLVLESAELYVHFQGDLQQVSIQALSLGPFDTKGIAETPIKVSLKFNRAPVQFDGNFIVQAEGQHLSGDLNVERLDLSKLPKTVAGLAGLLNLQQSIQVDNDASGVRLNASGDLLVTETSIDAGFSAASLQHSGNVVLDLSQPRPSMKAESQLTVEGLVSRDFGTLGSADWTGSVDVYSSSDYRVNGAAILTRVRPLGMGVIDRVAASSLALDEAALSVELLEISGLDFTVERAANGELVMLSKLLAREPAKTAGQDTAVLPAIKVKAFQLRDSKVEFIDRSVDPLVDIGLSNINANVQNFSLSESFAFDFVGDHQTATGLDAELKVKGDAELQSLTGAFDMALSNFELHEIAPYLGSGIRSGRMQISSGVKMNQGRLVVNNKVHIQNVKIDDRPQAASGDQMSLATALFLLKDKDDVVEFEIPIETDFDNFEIGVGNIVQTAMLKAARTTAVTYAQYALQPYGSLLLAKDLLGVISRPRFDPVGFDTATAVLNSKSQAYVEKLAGLLVNKSELTVTVCGYADMSELAQLREAEADANVANEASDVSQIKALAQARSHVVRDVLQAGGVQSKRLYACTATAETNGSLPRVEIAL